MSITDELRAWAKEHLSRSSILAIADRIDAEHEHAVIRVTNDALYHTLYHANDESMAELGWVRLPKDADGKYICADDDVEWMNGTKQGRVTGIGVGERDGWVWVLMEGKNVSIALKASDLHHYQPDTWERIIEDALDGYHDTDFDKLVARCKSLAGDAE